MSASLLGLFGISFLAATLLLAVASGGEGRCRCLHCSPFLSGNFLAELCKAPPRPGLRCSPSPLP